MKCQLVKEWSKMKDLEVKFDESKIKRWNYTLEATMQ
jgi:hypothetical protein